MLFKNFRFEFHFSFIGGKNKKKERNVRPLIFVMPWDSNKVFKNSIISENADVIISEKSNFPQIKSDLSDTNN